MKQLGLVSCQVKKHRYKKAENEHLNIPNTDLTGKALSMAYEVRGRLKVSCFIQIKAIITQVNNFTDYFGGIKLHEA
ncbi:hypothetical protein I8Y06_003937 [Photobacterium damselae]|nr:hypothetical protein [Photobacterium damselae]EHA1083020.1 hypothetical protein [Photobacterium damselae]